MNDYTRDVENLAVKHRAKDALRRLMAAGPLATPALRRGLSHAKAEVRVGCCVVLDHFLDEAAVPELVGTLNDKDDEVRAWALHALACDRCKEGNCRPGEQDSVPLALRMLAADPSPKVRGQAIRLLFPLVHHREDVRAAFERVRDTDSSPEVRKQAALRAPAGVMFLRSSPDASDRSRLRNSSTRAHLSVR